ncbi:MAG: nucleotide exchange factor GrpE [Cellulosilyticaceae bacterium]
MEENKQTLEEMQDEAQSVEDTEATTEEVVEEVVEETPAEVVEETDKASEYLDRLQRLMAEFDNFRKRSQKEKEGLYDLGVSSTITELLPIVDNFERALGQECQDKQFAEGISMIYKQLVSILEKVNVTAIEAEGQPFDPTLHSAIMQVQDETLGENVVAQVHQKGYMHKDKVIRYSMVTVAN